MDQFKEHIKAHRADLDIHTPERAVWVNINTRIREKRRAGMNVFMVFRLLAAACVIGLAAIGAYYLLFVHHEREKPVAVQNEYRKSGEAKQDVQGFALPSIPKTRMDTIKANKGWVAKKDISGPNPSGEKAAIPSPLKNMEGKYTALLKERIQKINTTPIYVNDTGYFTLYKNQLQAFTLIGDQLKEELAIFGADDQKLEAIIHIYKKKIELIERLLEEIKRMNRFPEQSKPNYLNL